MAHIFYRHFCIPYHNQQGTGKKVILTIHGASLHRQINQSGWLKKKLLIWALKNINSIIVVDPKIKNLLVSLGIISERVEYIPTLFPLS